MEPYQAIRTFLFAIPILRRLWHWLLERGMEIRIEGWEQLVQPVYEVNVGPNPTIFAMFKLTLRNHRTDRKERISRGWLVLNRRCLRFWSKRLCGIPLTIETHSGGVNDKPVPLHEIVLEPQSSGYEFYVWTSGPLTYQINRLPKETFLELELDVVGPIRKIRRTLERVKHSPLPASQ